MATTSKLPAVIDALLALATSILPVGAKVYDGNPDTTANASAQPTLFLVIGTTEPTGDGEAGDAQQSWPYMGGTIRDERGTVYCYAEAYNGAGNNKAARDSAWSLIDAFGEALRADVDLSGLVIDTNLAPSLRMTAETGRGVGARIRVFFSIEFHSHT